MNIQRNYVIDVLTCVKNLHNSNSRVKKNDIPKNKRYDRAIYGIGTYAMESHTLIEISMN